jgi:ATP-dependent RNA helicase RhlE
MHKKSSSSSYSSKNKSGQGSRPRAAASFGKRPAAAGPRQNRSGGNSSSNKRKGTFINPDKFINKAVLPAEEVVYKPQYTFADFEFSQPLQANLIKKGYQFPTPIQDKTLKPILEGRDIVGLANTGTGKTAAFLLPIIEKLHDKGGHDQALIMVPTRELATQIYDEFKAFSKNLQIEAAVCVGGTSMWNQISKLRRCPHIVIGTPGRLKDLYEQGELILDHIQFFVLDEADRMLDMGFIKDIQFLIEKLPAARQSLFFSATTSPVIQDLIKKFMKNPLTFSVRTTETSEQVDQNVIRYSSKEEKHQLLLELLEEEACEKVLIFGQTKSGVQRLAETLSKQGFISEAIHGNKSQPQRQRALEAFKQGKVKVLVATDVAARGIDVPNVSHVINFELPMCYEDYIHRIGRTGRGGKRGIALTFIESSHTRRH